MKKEIHPKYHTINVTMVDGTTYQTKSTWGKEGDTIRLDIDPTTHPAWTGKTAKIGGNQADKFSKKFGNIGSRKEA